MQNAGNSNMKTGASAHEELKSSQGIPDGTNWRVHQQQKYDDEQLEWDAYIAKIQRDAAGGLQSRGFMEPLYPNRD